jgi:hypothetical protein
MGYSDELLTREQQSSSLGLQNCDVQRDPQTNTAEMRAHVANCLVGGHELTRRGNKLTRDRIDFDCGGYRFQFTQTEAVVTGKLDGLLGRFVPTSEVVVAGVAESAVGEVRAVLDRVCWLLSFVGTCRVGCYGHEYPNGSGLVAKQAVSGTAQFFRPVFELRDALLVKRFVEGSYDAYYKLEGPRKLNVIIDYLAQAERGQQVLEVKLVLLFVCLESLKDTYARSSGIPYKKGYFWRTSPNSKETRFSFEELLTLMLDDVRMQCALKPVVRLRNELIHSGLSREPFHVLQGLYEDAHDIVREYLLRLLKYRGPYTPYAFERRGRVAEIT